MVFGGFPATSKGIMRNCNKNILEYIRSSENSNSFGRGIFTGAQLRIIREESSVERGTAHSLADLQTKAGVGF